MNIPKDFTVLIHRDKSMHVILNNYDGNFLSFLIIVLALPLFIATILLTIYLNVSFIITLILLLALVYWCVYHYKDRS